MKDILPAIMIWVVQGGPVSTLELHAPTQPHAAATVTFQNAPVHGPADSESFTLQWDGLRVGFDFEWNGAGQAEKVTAYPPEGYIAVPETISVPEHETQEIQIIKWAGM